MTQYQSRMQRIRPTGTFNSIECMAHRELRSFFSGLFSRLSLSLSLLLNTWRSRHTCTHFHYLIAMLFDSIIGAYEISHICIIYKLLTIINVTIGNFICGHGFYLLSPAYSLSLSSVFICARSSIRLL